MENKIITKLIIITITTIIILLVIMAMLTFITITILLIMFLFHISCDAGILCKIVIPISAMILIALIALMTKRISSLN